MERSRPGINRLPSILQWRLWAYTGFRGVIRQRNWRPTIELTHECDKSGRFPQSGYRVGSMLPPAIAAVLAVVFIAAKYPIAAKMAHENFYSSWIAISAEDVIWALAFWAVGGLGYRLLALKPRLKRLFSKALMSVAVLVALYAVLNVGIYGALKQPLNSRVLAMAKHVGDLGSSISEHCSLSMVLAIVLVPVATWLASRFLARYASGVWFRRGLLSLAGAWIVVGSFFLNRITPDGWQQRAGRNAHREILFSVVSDFLTGGRVEVKGNFAPEYLEDFKPASERRVEPWPKPPRNVILFVLESTSAEYMKLYGAPYNNTPNLSQEAGNSLLFESAYAHVGYTFSSFISLTYSIYAGLPWQYRPGGARPMPKGLAAFLKERGYRTAYFSSADPEWGGMDLMGTRAGIDEVFGPNQLAPNSKSSSWGCEDGPMMDGLLKWIDQSRARPFFAIAWTDGTHHPYTVSKTIPALEFQDEGHPVDAAKGRYLNAIRQADFQLGRLFAALRKSGLDKDTLVIVTGDHGEGFGSPHPVMGHGSALFEENLHVPLLFWSPTMFAGGRRDSKPCGHVDVLPTLAHMLAIEPPADWQGCSLFSPDHPKRVYFMADRDGYQFGMREGTRKQMLFVSAGFHRLYDLKNDPLEQVDISADEPETAEAMNGRLRAFVQFEEAFLKGERVMLPQLGVVTR